jgi:hypothetical protein
LHLHLRVDLSDGRRTLVPEGGDGGANEELQYMDVAQDLDPSPEVSVRNMVPTLTSRKRRGLSLNGRC